MAWSIEQDPETGLWHGEVVLSAYGAVFVEAETREECGKKLYRAQNDMIAEAEVEDIRAAYGPQNGS